MRNVYKTKDNYHFGILNWLYMIYKLLMADNFGTKNLQIPEHLKSANTKTSKACKY